jgi:hypothetical protein
MVQGRITLEDVNGADHEIDAEAVRQAARSKLGMVEGPFELNIFTKQVLARALQREQAERHERLRDAMTLGSTGYRSVLKEVAQIDDLLAQLGIEDARYVPGEAFSPPPAPTVDDAAAQTAPRKGDQTGLFEDQGTLALG